MNQSIAMRIPKMKHHAFVTAFLFLWTLASDETFAFPQAPFAARARARVLPLGKPVPSSRFTHSENAFAGHLRDDSKKPFTEKPPIYVRNFWRRLVRKQRVVARLPTILATVVTAAWVSTRPALAAAAITATSTGTTAPPPVLGWRNLCGSTLVLVTLGALPLSLLVRGGGDEDETGSTGSSSSLARTLLVSAGRCAVQVSLLGSLLLQRMMRMGATNPALVGAWIFAVGLLAGRECVSRIRYRYPGMHRNLYGSIATGGWVVLSLALGLGLLGTVEPWFDPRTWIPIAGMLFGNTLNAAALAAASVTKHFATGSDTVELRLARGANIQDAIAPLVDESCRIALLPTLNGLAATGIVHIPGMMSGQILAGQSPQQAALYQIVINFLIATTALVTVQLIIRSSVRALVDTKGRRLRSGVLEPITNDSRPQHFSLASMFSWMRPAPRPNASLESITQARRLRPHACTNKASTDGTAAEDRKENPSSKMGTLFVPVLALDGLEVVRANATVDLTLQPGDRIAVSGRSGTGKSQLLRTIVGLEEPGGGADGEGGDVSLFGMPIDSNDLPRFRSRVSLVPQAHPPLEGTPNQFYREVLQFQHRQRQKSRQRQRERNDRPGSPVTPSDIASEWNLGPDAFDQPWRTLSGGESQRASLAIALALQPDVLLLDESTNSLDDATSVLVEETLRKSNIPILIVTHSEDQLERFCTHRLDLQ